MITDQFSFDIPVSYNERTKTFQATLWKSDVEKAKGPIDNDNQRIDFTDNSIAGVMVQLSYFLLKHGL